MHQKGQTLLKQYFGYDSFREGQAEFIEAIMGGRDVLGVMPTGSGKSICYQIPAVMLDGITFVVSPLISLMRDQVLSLSTVGISAAYINSSLTDVQLNKAITNARNGMYKIIYIAPERLLSPSMLELASSLDISLLAVDEAHCISQWGQDFRPSYLGILKFLDCLPKRPVIAAFTATATPVVREDIVFRLGQDNPLTLVTGFDRPNLYFEVKQPKDKFAELIKYLGENDACGIIYCSTRKEVEALTVKLVDHGYSAARYHAGLSDSERSGAQDDFLCDRIKIIVATNAFGMGIDKSDVRFVIHYNMPQNVESYYQEAGRAGRDGQPSDCILYYARRDINTILFLINKIENQEEVFRNKKLLGKMEEYCQTDTCLRQYILNYFGENSPGKCGNCGNCDGLFDKTDVTTDAQKILAHITRLNKAGSSFMFTHTVDIIQGKSTDFRDLPTYGIMKGATRNYIRSIINKLCFEGYLYEGSYLKVTPKAIEVLFGGARVTIKQFAQSKKYTERQKKYKADFARHDVDGQLLLKLKQLRLKLAQKRRVAAFVIFSDATLIDMCQKLPRNMDEMLCVSGVGPIKYEKYGEQFLTIICEHTVEE